MRSLRVLLTFVLATIASTTADAAERNRVAVIGLGPAATAGELQRTVETRLVAGRRLTLVDLAGARGDDPPVDPATLREVTTLFQQASDAYYEDRSAVALDRLSAIALILEKSGSFPLAERIRLLLWRTAVFLALNDQAQAESEALAALSLDPKLVVDLQEFRPSLKEAIDRIRRKHRFTPIAVDGLPPRSWVKLDGRTVGPTFHATAGRHTLAVAAPGRREVTRTFQVPSPPGPAESSGDARTGEPMALVMALPSAIDPPVEVAFDALLWRGAPGPDDAVLLAAFASRGVDWLVLVGTRGEMPEVRAAIVALDGSARATANKFTAAEAAGGALAAWTEQKLRVGIEVRAPGAEPRGAGSEGRGGDGRAISDRSPGGRGPVPPRESAKARARGAVDVDAEGGGLFVLRTRSLRGRDWGPFDSSFNGAGPRARVAAGWRALFLEADAMLLSYSFSSLEVDLPNGEPGTTDGGSSHRVRASVGGRWRPKGANGPSLAASVGTIAETHRSNDFEDPEAGPDDSGTLGLLTSYRRRSAELRLSTAVPFGIGGTAYSFRGALAVAPGLSWTESPEGSSGDDPDPGPAVGWSVGVSADAGARWTFGLYYEGELRQVRFDGVSTIPTDPEIVDATIDESFHALGLTAGWRF